MTTTYCTCNSPSSWSQAADSVSLEKRKVNDELEPLPNGFTDHCDGGDESDPCLLGGENVVFDEPSERKQKIDSVWQYYLAHNTLHGLHYVFDTKSLIRKILWVAVLLTAGGVFVNEVKASINQYFDFPFNTLSTVEYPTKLGFPAISICDLRDIRRTMLKESKLDSAYNYHAQGNFTGSDSEASIEGILNETFSLLDDILISCSLKRGVARSKAVHCDRRNFTSFLSSSGHTCYTLNSGSGNRPLLETDNVGPFYGLHMILNTRPLEEGSTSRARGFRVILHQQGELPLMRVGFHVPPGYVTYVDMKKQKIRNLRNPYRTNCGGKNLDQFLEYSRNKCFLEDITKHVADKCGCSAWFTPEEYEQASNFECPVDCERMAYEARLSTALFLPQKLLPLKKHAALKRAKHMPNDTESMVQFMLEHYVGLSFFFSELSVDIIEQTPVYGVFRLVGDVGGQLGLVLGASVVTLLEVIDLVIMVGINYFRVNLVKKKDGSSATWRQVTL